MNVPRSLRSGGDIALAVVLSVAFQIEVWLPLWMPVDDPDPALIDADRWVAAVLGAALTLSIAWRRSHALVGLALAFPTLLVTRSGGLDRTPALTLTLIVVLFSVGSYTRDVAALTGAVGVGGLIAFAILRDPDARLDIGDLIWPVIVLGGAWLSGLALRVRRDREAALEQRAAAMERERDAQALAAVAEERARIGRELHDVVAHAMGIVVLQARGGRASLDRDPSATREALDAIEATGVQAITEMHRFVGMIRVDDDPASLAPVPGLRDLDRLIEHVREAGLPVDLQIDGAPVDVAPGVDLSAYRIVQEALTNALRHAGAATARVRIGYAEAGLDLEISDTGIDAGGSATGDGLGLIGMRERAALVGGSLVAEPLAGGGFVVRAHLPIVADPAP